jgi:hypothetical protein
MKRKPKSALAAHRARLAKAGRVRLEVTVRREDVPLVRGVANTLNDPELGPVLRAQLDRANANRTRDFKKLLMSLPSFDGFDLDRSTERDRDVEL